MKRLGLFAAFLITSCLFGDPGSIKGELSEKEQSLIEDHLYFDLTFTQLNGETSKCRIKLDTANVTAMFH